VRLRRALGFGVGAEGEILLVVQADALNAVFDSLVVIPLDASVELYAGDPTAVRVPAAECGARQDHAAVTTQIRSLLTSELAPGVAGRASAATMAAVDEAIRRVLDLA
jgi:mRNA-degrading endonuclease toxin of MazEF toxin-antitoxin module